LLTKTEQFEDAAWTKFRTTISANVVVAPNGTTTADKMVEDVNTNSHVVDQNGMGYALNAQQTITVYGKEAERKYLNVAAAVLGAGVNYFVATFDVSAGTVIKSANALGGTLVSTSITPEGNGWYKCVVTGSFNTGSQIRLQIGISDSNNPTYGADGGVSYTGDGTSGIYIWGADLRPTNQGVGLPAYQRVNTSTDYDSTGFPVYIKPNGSNQFMQTNSINFSATDKMTVWQGVRKLNDAGNAVVAELSTNASSNAGAFWLLAPLGAAANYNFASRGTNLANVSATPFAAPITNAVTGIGNISGDVVTIRINGVQIATDATDQGTGNYGNYAAYFYMRAGTSLPFNGNDYGSIARGAASTAAQIANGEAYINSKTKAYTP
jgi:hypothetical protein